MSKTFYFSFGDLAMGDKFVYFNPGFHAKPDFQREHMVKISPRRYRDSLGNVFRTGSNTGVARVPASVS